MSRDYVPYVPQTVFEVLDHLASMLFDAPDFRSDLFPRQSIDTAFYALNQGLRLVRHELGDELYGDLRRLSNRARMHFEADPEDLTQDAVTGRELILDMEKLLRARTAHRS